MAYFDPNQVQSPKASVGKNSVKVIHNGGEWNKDDSWSGWSVAELEWEGSPSVGCRWNGNGNNVGNPQSRGVPTWFILPDPVASEVLKHMQERKAKG